MKRRAGPVKHRWIAQEINRTESEEIHHKRVILVANCFSLVSNLSSGRLTPNSYTYDVNNNLCETSIPSAGDYIQFQSLLCHLRPPFFST